MYSKNVLEEILSHSPSISGAIPIDAEGWRLCVECVARPAINRSDLGSQAILSNAALATFIASLVNGYVQYIRR